MTAEQAEAAMEAEGQLSATDTPIPLPRVGAGEPAPDRHAVGVDNLSLVGALVMLIVLISVIAPIIGVQNGNFFWSWQNLMNSLAQSIVIVGLLAIGETVVIVGGALDISIGSIASVASVFSAIVITQGVIGTFGAGSMPFAILAGIAAGLFCGSINGFIVGVEREPDHRDPRHSGCLRRARIPHRAGRQARWRCDSAGLHLAGDGPDPRGPADPRPRGSAVARRADRVRGPDRRDGDHACRDALHGLRPVGLRSAATRPRPACPGINLRNVRIAMYLISGAIAGLAGVLLTARTTSGNPINGRSLELQAITAVFLGGAATTGGQGTIVGTFSRSSWSACSPTG